MNSVPCPLFVLAVGVLYAALLFTMARLGAGSGRPTVIGFRHKPAAADLDRRVLCFAPHMGFAPGETVIDAEATVKNFSLP
jgi:hypothetical protein